MFIMLMTLIAAGVTAYAVYYWASSDVAGFKAGKEGGKILAAADDLYVVSINPEPTTNERREHIDVTHDNLECGCGPKAATETIITVSRRSVPPDSTDWPRVLCN